MHARLALESRAGSLLPAQGQAKAVGPALSLRTPAWWKPVAKGMGNFNVIFFTNFFFKKKKHGISGVNARDGRLSCDLLKEVGFNRKSWWKKGGEGCCPSVPIFLVWLAL